MYDDDGTSLNYHQGDFTITKITSLLSSEILSVKIQKPLSKFILLMHRYMTKIYLKKMSLKIIENGKAVSIISKDDVSTKEGWYYDENKKVLWIKSIEKNNLDNEGKFH